MENANVTNISITQASLMAWHSDNNFICHSLVFILSNYRLNFCPNYLETGKNNVVIFASRFSRCVIALLKIYLQILVINQMSYIICTTKP